MRMTHHRSNAFEPVDARQDLVGRDRDSQHGVQEMLGFPCGPNPLSISARWRSRPLNSQTIDEGPDLFFGLLGRGVAERFRQHEAHLQLVIEPTSSS